MNRIVLYLIILFAVSLTPGQLFAWDPNENVPISVTRLDQGNPQAVSDGNGGAIIVWEDTRHEFTGIFAQHLDASGHVVWATNGVPVCATNSNQLDLGISADGHGGAYIVWRDMRSGAGDIYMQHVSATGGLLWGTNGRALTHSTWEERNPFLLSNGNEGFFVIWEDLRNSHTALEDIYAQKVTPAGDVIWRDSGMPVWNAAGSQIEPVAVCDDEGGMIVACQGVVAQRVSANGHRLWGESGIQVSSMWSETMPPRIVSDCRGGAIIVWTYRWEDWLSAQRLSPSGAPLWGLVDIRVCPGDLGSTMSQRDPDMMSDGLGGAYIVWEDYRYSNNHSQSWGVWGQRIDSLGTRKWSRYGRGLGAVTPNDQLKPRVVTDNNGGIIVTWVSERNGNKDIFAERFNRSGVQQWSLIGIPVSTAPNAQSTPNLVSDGSSGAIIAWSDMRRGVGMDIFAQQVVKQVRQTILVDFDRTEGISSLSYPNPFNPSTKIEFKVPNSTLVELRVFDALGREVAILVNENLNPGTYQRTFDGSNLASGMYFYRLQAGEFTETRKLLLLK